MNHAGFGWLLRLEALVGLAVSLPVLPLALIWTAHIAFDRTLGSGLKSTEGFGYTHLGLVGRARV